MTGCKFKIGTIISLVILVSAPVFPQQLSSRDSLPANNFKKRNLKPELHYSVGSSFLFVPHYGTVSGFTFTPQLTLPLTPRLSIEGGIIAGHYNSSIINFNPEGGKFGTFNELSIYGAASYNIAPRLTLYGAGIKEITGTSPFYLIPKSSYIIGSSFNFGSFSLGASVQVSRWNNDFGPSLLNGSPGFYPSPFPFSQH